MHEEEVEVLDVVDEEGLVARGHHVAGLLVGAVADLGHGDHATEATTDTAINTLGLAPGGADAVETIALVAEEARGACIMLVSSVSVHVGSGYRSSMYA